MPIRPVLLLLWLAFLPAAPAVADASPDLLANGGFEETGPGDSPFAGWRFYVWSGSALPAPDRGARPSGGAAARLQGLVPGRAGLHQRAVLAPGRYRLSGLAASWDLRAGGEGPPARVHLEIQGRKPISLALPAGDRGWTPFEIVFDLDRESAATLYVFIQGTGYLWVDDLDLRAVGTGGPAAVGARVAERPVEPLRFVPPPGPADLLLAGYCTDPGQAGRPHCRRLAGIDPATLAPLRHREPREIARFDPPRPVGSRAGHLDLGPGSGLPTDWSGYDTLEIRVANPGPAPLEGYIEIRDRQSRNYWSRVNWYTHFDPGEQWVRIPLQIFVGEKSVIKERRRLDLSGIVRLFLDLSGEGELRVSQIRLASDPPWANAFPRLLRLDAGTDTSPVENGFVQLTAARGYRPELGYGLDPGTRIVKSEDRRHPDNLLRDWVSIASGGLSFDLPNGDYRVWMMLEDPGYWEYVQNYDRRAVLAEGREVYADSMSPADLWARVFAHQWTEDLPGDDIWGRYIRARYRPVEFQVRVTDGQLNLGFQSGRYKTFANTLSALLIWPTEEDRRARAFVAELWERLKDQFGIEYAQTRPPADAAPGSGAGGPVGQGAGQEATGAAPVPGLVVFQRHWDRDLWATDRPAPGERVSRLELDLARGEIEPLTLDLYAERDLTLTDLRVELPGLGVEPYKVRSKLTRATDDGARYVAAPRLLDPLTLPLDLKAGQSRRLWLSVSAPVEAQPGVQAQPGVRGGTVQGELRLVFGDRGRLKLPVAARVRPFRLPQADLPFGYLGSVPVYTESAFPEAVADKRRADIIPSLELVRRHGMTQFSGGIGGAVPSQGEAGLVIDFAAYDAVLSAAAPRFPFPPHSYSGLAPARLGFERYRLAETQRSLGLPPEQALARVLAATRAHGGGQGWPEPVYSVGDEPKGEGLAASVALAQAVRAAGARSSVFTSLTDTASPGLGLLGHVDLIYLTLHNAWGLEQIRKAGGDCGTYNLAGRYARGLYQYRLRRMGCRAGYFQFAFNATHIDPYYALDGREDDLAAAFPTDRPGVLVPTLDLFRFGEALDDYRYLLALEEAIARAGDTLAARQARGWLDDQIRDLEVDSRALARPPRDDAALDRMRREAAQRIAGLKGP